MAVRGVRALFAACMFRLCLMIAPDELVVEVMERVSRLVKEGAFDEKA